MMHVEGYFEYCGGVQYCGVSYKRYRDLRVSIRKNIAALFCPSPFSLCLADWLLSHDAI